MDTPRLQVKKITVLPDRLEVIVKLRDEASRLVSRQIADACLAKYPELLAHPCKNSCGPLFGDILYSTSLPHLLEHLVITLQVRSDAANNRTPFSYLGTTEWLNVSGLHQGANTKASECSLEAKLSLRFRNDIVALSCLNEAVDFLNKC